MRRSYFKTLSFAELYNQVSKTAQHLKELGVTKGDRVAGFLPNFAGSIVAMLATASVGQFGLAVPLILGNRE